VLDNTPGVLVATMGAFLVFLAGKAQMAGTSPTIHSFK
jgi:hypothetical protein